MNIKRRLKNFSLTPRKKNRKKIKEFKNWQLNGKDLPTLMKRNLSQLKAEPGTHTLKNMPMHILTYAANHQ